MSDTAAVPAPKPKKSKKLLLLVGGAVVLFGGAGGGLYASGMIGGGGHKAEKDLPHLVLREGVDEDEAEKYASPTGDKKADPEKFQASYFELKEKFTSNLLDSTSFVQLELAAATYYDQRVLDNLAKHEMAIRSAVLMTLADQDADDLGTPEGKRELKKALTGAINGVLKSREGFGGIDDVYFKSLVIQ